MSGRCCRSEYYDQARVPGNAARAARRLVRDLRAPPALGNLLLRLPDPHPALRAVPCRAVHRTRSGSPTPPERGIRPIRHQAVSSVRPYTAMPVHLPQCGVQQLGLPNKDGSPSLSGGDLRVECAAAVAQTPGNTAVFEFGHFTSGCATPPRRSSLSSSSVQLLDARGFT